MEAGKKALDEARAENAQLQATLDAIAEGKPKEEKTEDMDFSKSLRKYYSDEEEDK